MITRKFLMGSSGSAYIAGLDSGIVTVAGKPASRDIVALDALTLAVVLRTASLENGNYILMGLESNKLYLVMARDYKKEYEPFVWDYVAPADDLTITEQQALWQSWQTN